MSSSSSSSTSSSHSSSNQSSSSSSTAAQNNLIDLEAESDGEDTTDPNFDCPNQWPEELHNGEVSQTRGWIATVFTIKAEWLAQPFTFHDWLKARCNGTLVCAVHQRESGQLQQHQHLQCFFQCTNKYKVQAMKNKFKGFGWVGAAADNFAAAQYCQKQLTRLDGPYITGTLPTTPSNKGSRSDITKACDAIKSHKGMRHVVDNYSAAFVKYHKGFAAMEEWCNTNIEKGKPMVHWLHGPTGCSKTHTAYQMCAVVDPKKMSTIKLMPTTKSEVFFNGYTDQKCVIFDDFDGKVEIEKLFQFLDPGICMANTKGGYRPWMATLIIFTCNVPPEVLYMSAFMKNDKHKDAFLRRIDSVRHMNVPYAAAPASSSSSSSSTSSDLVPPMSALTVANLEKHFQNEDDDAFANAQTQVQEYEECEEDGQLSPLGMFYYGEALKNLDRAKNKSKK